MIHNAIPYSAQLQKGLGRAAGLEPGASGVERLGETLQPILDPYASIEMFAQRGEVPWMVSPSSAAVAGEFSQVGIRNPTGSGYLCMVDAIYAFNNGAVNIIELRMRAQGTIDATASPLSRDSRLANFTAGVGPLLSLAGTEAAVLGTIIARWGCTSSNHSEWYREGIVLSPGFELLVGCSVVNMGIIATLSGRFRPALPGELTV